MTEEVRKLGDIQKVIRGVPFRYDLLQKDWWVTSSNYAIYNPKW